ncbi:MAG: TIGR04086 family membrane protein [Lachnospiraceae bacterium]|nr:TIGR04086 family membrane protein [Lachnospiraceae bacterium]
MIKNILGASIRSFVVSFILLLIFALIMFFGDVEDKTVGVMVVITYFVSNLIGGIYIGKKVEKYKYLWGIIAGIIYFLCIAVVSCIGNNGININESMAIGMFISIIGGMIGGMIS